VGSRSYKTETFSLPCSVVMLISDRVPVPVMPLIILVSIFGGSLAIFLLLTKRWTMHRPQIELAEWASQSKFVFRQTTRAFVPPPLETLKNLDPQIRWLFAGDTTSLVQLQAQLQRIDPAASKIAQFHLLIRRTISHWSPTGLRPAAQPASMLDLFSLASFPLISTNERFVVFGTDQQAARQMGQSQARALLPPDIGLLRHGEYLLLDFSTRPFDQIEFERMLALADQLEKIL
jgi:hypothetical protein